MPDTAHQNRGYKRHWRNFLIYPRFQLLIIGVNLAIIAGTLILCAVTVRNTLLDLAPAGAFSGMEAQFYQKYLKYQQAQFAKAFLISSLLTLSLSFGLTLWISHRLAGPLVRLRGFFRALSEFKGEVPELHFRDGDFLQELPPLVNDAVQHIIQQTRQPKSHAS